MHAPGTDSQPPVRTSFSSSVQLEHGEMGWKAESRGGEEEVNHLVKDSFL